jgi:TLC domain
MKLSYHLYELGYTLVMHRARPDFPEYVLHHLMTWSLIFFSYSLNMLPIGAAVMILHDITDLACTIFKLTVDVTPFLVQGVGYISMLVSWVYLRLWYFPGHVIYRLHEECYFEGKPCPNMHYQMLNMLYAFMTGLTCLHVFWFYLMIKGLVRRCRFKGGFFNTSIVSMKSNVNE